MAENVLLKIEGDIRDIKAKLGTLEKEFSKTMKGAEKQTKQLGNSFKTLKGLIAGAFTVGVIYKFKEALIAVANAALEQEKADMALEATLINLKLATKNQIEMLKQYAAELQETTTYGNEEIERAMAMLGTFQLTTEQIRQAIPRVMDMAAAMEMMTGRHMDLADVANMVGKAINGTVGFLTRWGVVIDEEAVKADKFTGILKSIDDNFKGLSETLANTTLGQMEQLKNYWVDIKEIMGAVVLEAFKPMLEKMREMAGLIVRMKNFQDTTLGQIDATREKLKNLKKEVQLMGAMYERGEITAKEYHEFIKKAIQRRIELQNRLSELNKQRQAELEAIRKGEKGAAKATKEHTQAIDEEAKKIEELENRIKAYQEVLMMYDKQIQDLKGIIKQYQQQIERMGMLTQQAGKETTDTMQKQRKTIEEWGADLEGVTNYLSDRLADCFSSNIKSAFDTTKGYMQSFKQTWSEFLHDLVVTVIRAAIKTAITRLVGAAIGAITGNATSAAFGGALGDFPIGGGTTVAAGERYASETIAAATMTEGVSLWQT